MEKPLRGRFSEMVDKHTDHGDAKPIQQNRNGNAGGEEHDPLPQSILQQVRAKEREAGEWKQVAESATGFDYLQLNRPQVDNVAFPERSGLMTLVGGVPRVLDIEIVEEGWLLKGILAGRKWMRPPAFRVRLPAIR